MNRYNRFFGLFVILFDIYIFSIHIHIIVVVVVVGVILSNLSRVDVLNFCLFAQTRDRHNNIFNNNDTHRDARTWLQTIKFVSVVLWHLLFVFLTGFIVYKNNSKYSTKHTQTHAQANSQLQLIQSQSEKQNKNSVASQLTDTIRWSLLEADYSFDLSLNTIKWIFGFARKEFDRWIFGIVQRDKTKCQSECVFVSLNFTKRPHKKKAATIWICLLKTWFEHSRLTDKTTLNYIWRYQKYHLNAAAKTKQNNWYHIKLMKFWFES